MINWPAVAKRLGFETDTEMWTELYVNQRLSLRDLQARFNISHAVLTCALSTAGIKRRGRGGPNNIKYEVLSEEECRRYREEGIANVARRLKRDYMPLLHLVIRSEKAAAELKAVVEQMRLTRGSDDK